MYFVVVVQLLSCVRFFAIPWTIARQAPLSITNSQSLLKLMSIESVMPSNHFILCLLPLPSRFPSIRVSSIEVVQWLGLCASSSEDVGLIPSQETNIPHATQHGQKKKAYLETLGTEQLLNNQLHV